MWITSAGGPLVLVPEMLAAQWHGIGDGGGDYAAACAIDDYVGVIRWNGVNVLVLNDEPLATTCLTSGLVMFLRWVYAPSEEAILNVLPDIERHVSGRQDGVAFNCQTDKYVLFDAGAPGRSNVARIEVDLVPGSYVVETCVWNPNDDVELVVHVLRSVHDS